MSEILSLKKDVFADGQVRSKIWLCRELERILKHKKPQTIWTLGGWAGLLPFLLLSRERLPIKKIISFDENPLCAPQALALNDAYHCNQKGFQAQTRDANELNYEEKSEPDVVINTAVEHFTSDKWYQNIPQGKILALQSCDLRHEEHKALCRSTGELAKKFPLRKFFFGGSLWLNYERSSFSRYMIIGEK